MTMTSGGYSFKKRSNKTQWTHLSTHKTALLENCAWSSKLKDYYSAEKCSSSVLDGLILLLHIFKVELILSTFICLMSGIIFYKSCVCIGCPVRKMYFWKIQKRKMIDWLIDLYLIYIEINLKKSAKLKSFSSVGQKIIMKNEGRVLAKHKGSLERTYFFNPLLF